MSPAPSLYRGREGMWSWLAHRVTGVAVFFFLVVHVVDTSMLRVSPEAYNTIIGTYKTPFVGLIEAGLVGVLAFHAFNGIRIILIDTWPAAARRQRYLAWGVVALWIGLMAGFLPRHLGNVFGGE